MSHPTLAIHPDHDTLIRAVANYMTRRIAAIAAETGRCTLALSGGSGPPPLYRLLTQPQYSNSIPWQKVHVYWGDERYVPHDHPDSNYRLARETLLDFVPIPANQIYPMPTAADPMTDAGTYEQTLRAAFPNDTAPTFDINLMGMGDDGHTASIFPHSIAVQEYDKWVLGYTHTRPDGPTTRLTVTYPILNRSREIIMLVAGAKKAMMLQRVLETKPNAEEIPVQGIQPQGVIHWMVDAAAAQQLKLKK